MQSSKKNDKELYNKINSFNKLFTLIENFEQER